jgi:hypothetical protein
MEWRRGTGAAVMCIESKNVIALLGKDIKISYQVDLVIAINIYKMIARNMEKFVSMTDDSGNMTAVACA